MMSVLMVMMVVGLGNSLRDGFPSLNLPELTSSLEGLWSNDHRSVFFQYPFVTVLFGFVVLGIPTLLATLYGITLHTFYSRCILNSSSLSVMQFILLLVRSLIAFPMAATMMFLAMSWQVVKKVGFLLRAWYSPGFQQTRRPNNLAFIDDLFWVSLWYLLFPWPGNCALSWDWSDRDMKGSWKIPDSIRTMPISSDRLLRWLPVGLCILTWVAYLGPNIVLHQSAYIRGGPYIERHPFDITFWVSVSVFLADYLVVTLRVVPFLKAQSAAHPRITE